MNKNIFHQVGKRKTSVARVFMSLSKLEYNKITVNNKNISKYFNCNNCLEKVNKVLNLTEDKFDIKVNLSGGGYSGQAEALLHGIAKTLFYLNENLKETLKKSGFLKRDLRIKEAKKSGRLKARKLKQTNKR